MADEKLGRAVLELVTDQSGLDAGLTDVTTKTAGLKESFADAGKSLQAFGKSTTDVGKGLSIGLTAPVTAVVGGLVALALQSASTADTLITDAQAAGLSTDAYQELSFALAQVANVSDEQAKLALSTLTQTIGDAAIGTKAAEEALAQLGFTQAEITAGTIDTEDAFTRFTQAMRDAKSPAEAAALAADLVGARVGKSLAGALRSSGDQVDVLRQQFTDLGLGWSGPSLTAAADMADAIDVMKLEFSALGREIATAVLPILTNTLVPFIKETAIPMARDFADAIAGVIKWFSDLPAPVQQVVLVVGGLLTALGPVLVVFGTLVSAIGAVLPVLATVGAAIAAIGAGPLLLIVGAVTAVVVAWRNWDQITAIVSGVYNAVKTWMVDKFNAVVESIKGKIDAVTGFFKSMKDAVVGHSFVPEMIDGIAQEFLRLDDEMVGPTDTATTTVGGLFESLKTTAIGAFKGLLDDVTQSLGKTLLNLTGFTKGAEGIFSGAFGGGGTGGGGGGSIGGILGGFFKGSGSGAMSGMMGAGMSIATGVMSGGMSVLAGLAFEGVKKIGSFFKKMFSKPNAEELAGRDIVHAFEGNLSSMLTDSQRLEAGNESWKKTTIAVRDAYMAVGLSEQQALDDVARLWKSSKEGGDASRQVVEQITERMKGFGGAIRGAFDQFPDEVRIPVRFDVDDLPEPNRMAAGGIGRVHEPTLFMAGEAGPEDFAFSGAHRSFGDQAPGAGINLSDLKRAFREEFDQMRRVLAITLRDAKAGAV